MKMKLTGITCILVISTLCFASTASATYEIRQLSDATASTNTVYYLNANDVGDAVFNQSGVGTLLYRSAGETITNTEINNGRGYIPSMNNHGDFIYDINAGGAGNMLYSAATGTSTSVNTLTGVASIGVGMTMVNDNGDLGITVGNRWPSFGVGFYDNSSGVYTELSAPSYAGFPEDLNNNGDMIWTKSDGTYLYDNAMGTTTKLFAYTGGYSFGPYSYANMNDSQDIAYTDRAQRNYYTDASGTQYYYWVWDANIYVAATGQIVNLGECGSGDTPILNNNGQAVFLNQDIRNRYPVGRTDYSPDEIEIYDLATDVTTQITSNTTGQTFGSPDINNRGDIVYIAFDETAPFDQSILVYRTSDQSIELVASTVNTSISDLHINDNGDLFWKQYDRSTFVSNVFKASYVQTITDIIGMVDHLLVDGGISNVGTANSLTAILKNALNSQERGNIRAATNQLRAFINSTNDKRGVSITEEAADALIEAAQAVIDNM